MAHPNEAVIRQAYEAFSAGDMETLAGVFTENAVWHVPVRNKLAGDYEGVDAILGYYANLDEATGGTFRIDEIHDVLANDEHVVSMHRGSSRKDGVTHTFNEVFVFHVSDGKIAEAWEQTSDPYEYDELIG